MVNELFSVFGDSKSLIIEFLAREYPLTIKSIYRRVLAKKKRISYQAVHKLVLGLSKTGVLVKENQYYKLNKKWLLSGKKFFSLKFEKYKSGKGRLEFPV